MPAMTTTSGLDDNAALLVHPLGKRDCSREQEVSRLANIMPPLGVASMAAYLESRGKRAEIVDFYAYPDSFDHMRQVLRGTRPRVVGFSCTTATFHDGVRLARLVRSESPESVIVFGGVHVSSQREKALEEYPELDIAVVGEGEEALLALMDNGGRASDDIPGLVYRRGDDVLFTGFRDKMLDLDDLPFPAYEKLRGFPRSYPLPIFNYPKAPHTACSSSRGCPYACSYCDRSVFRRSYRFNSAQYLYEHMRYLRERFGVRHINFYDDQFTFRRKRVDELMDLLLDKPLGMTFNCAVRANHIDEALLRRMKAAGCWMVSLGIETGDQELLTRHQRKIDLGGLAETILTIKRAGLRVKGLLMMGLPGENEATIQKTMDYVFSLPVDDFNLTKFTPFPGSPVYQEIKDANGALGEFDEDWESMDCMHFLFVPGGMTRERMEELHTAFYKKHYSSPRTLLDYASMLWRSPDSWRRFALNAGNFLSFAFSGGTSGADTNNAAQARSASRATDQAENIGRAKGAEGSGATDAADTPGGKGGAASE